MLTLQFIPYSNIANLSSEQRISRIINFVKQDKIVLLEGRLREEEEAELIKKTMECINEEFTGIELGVVHSEKKETSLYKAIHKLLVRLLLGNREGFTIIGPANIVKEIKKDPDKIELMMKENTGQKKKSKTEKNKKKNKNRH